MVEFLGYLVSPILLNGAVLSLKIAALALVGGLALGLTLALLGAGCSGGSSKEAARRSEGAAWLAPTQVPLWRQQGPQGSQRVIPSALGPRHNKLNK